MTLEGPFGGGDLFARLQSLQADLASAQETAAHRTAVGSAAGGAVTIEATGELSFTRVRIDPSVVDPSDPALLEDLVLAALRDLAGKLEELRREAMGSAVTNALGGLFGGLGALEDDELDEEDDFEDDEPDEDAAPGNGAPGGQRGGALGPGAE